jgi:hypothetical protein
MRALALATVFLFVGCKVDRVAASASTLALGADRVVFPRTFVGYPTKATLELRNEGTPVRVAELQASTPFAAEAGPVELAGGSSVQVTLTFAPQTAGDFEGTVQVESEGQSLVATLAGTAEPVPACQPSGPCWRAQFDLEAQGCVATKKENGAACADDSPCLVASVCIDGACVGSAKDCDDHDACTTDACDPVTGCVHFAATGRCGASTDPCQVPTCDSEKGCGFVDAADGTRCGPADCSTAQVCMLGVCKQLVVSDGAACGVPSPCQARGLCLASACARPAAADLQPAWTAWVGTGRYLYWDSIADAAGNVYWREGTPDYTSAFLVSVTRSGFQRFAVPILPASQMALIEDRLVLRSGANLEARSESDGALVWSRVFTPASDAVGAVDLRTLARGPKGTVYVGFKELGKQSPPELVGSVITALSLVDGATQWEARFPGQQLDDQATPVDEAGYVYVGLSGTDGTRRYVGLSPLGAVRWNIANPHANPAAVFGGRVYHWDHWLSDTSTGAWVNTEPPTLNVAGYPRLALGAVNYAGTTTAQVPNCSTPGTLVNGTAMQLVRVDPASSSMQWTLEIAGADGGGLSMTNTVLTSRATVVFSQSEDYCSVSKRYVLREVSAQGEPSFSCRLPGPESYWGEGLLNDGMWVSAVSDPVTGVSGVRAFELPGLVLPEHGWATAWGSPARDGHSR